LVEPPNWYILCPGFWNFEKKLFGILEAYPLTLYKAISFIISIVKTKQTGNRKKQHSEPPEILLLQDHIFSSQFI